MKYNAAVALVKYECEVQQCHDKFETTENNELRKLFLWLPPRVRVDVRPISAASAVTRAIKVAATCASTKPTANIWSHTTFCELSTTWRWRRDMETLSTLLVLWEGDHQSPVDSLHKGLIMWTFYFSLFLVWTVCRGNSPVVGDLRLHDTHVMCSAHFNIDQYDSELVTENSNAFSWMKSFEFWDHFYGVRPGSIKHRFRYSAPWLNQWTSCQKPQVSDPGVHQGTCVTHVPWCMSGSLTRGGGENVPGIPGVCVTHNFTYLVRGPWLSSFPT